MRDVLFPYCHPLHAAWFWILNYFGQKGKASPWEVCRDQKPGRAVWCPANKRGLDLLLHSEQPAAEQLCSPPMAPHQALLLQEHWMGQGRPLPHPLLLILAPQEHGEGEIGGLPRGQGDGSRARSSQAVPRVTTSGGLVEISSQFNLLLSPVAGGSLTLISSWGYRIFSLLFVCVDIASVHCCNWLVLFLYSSQHIWSPWIRSLGLIVAKK